METIEGNQNESFVRALLRFMKLDPAEYDIPNLKDELNEFYTEHERPLTEQEAHDMAAEHRFHDLDLSPLAERGEPDDLHD